MYQPCAPRKKKTDIVRKRTGCQNCRKRRRKCDEAHPECQACVRRGVKCSGYQRTLAFKDLSDQTAEVSRKFEAARWAQLREEDERLGRQRQESDPSPSSSEQLSPAAVKAGDTGSGDSGLGLWEVVTYPHDLSQSPPGKSNGSDGFSVGEPTPEFSSSPSGESSQGQRSGNITSRSHSASLLSESPTSILGFQNVHVSDQPAVGPPSPSIVLFSPKIEPQTNVDRRMSDATTFLPDEIFSISPGDVSLSSWGAETVPGAASHHLVKLHPDSPPMNDPLATGMLSLDPDASLLSHFESTVMKNFPVPFTFRHRWASNDCFRLAILALSSANLTGLERQFSLSNSTVPVYNESVTQTYYLAAVRELHRQLQLPEPPDREALGAAAIVLAYYEMESGTPNGTMSHAKGVDAILSKLDAGNFTSPEIYKAWKLLQYDTNYMKIAYRKSAEDIKAHQAYALTDPQLAVRDIFINLDRLCARLSMELCFPPGQCTPGASPSEEAAEYIGSVLKRKCDRRNIEDGDVHRRPLTREEVMFSCDTFSKLLDRWHSSLDYAGLPIVKMGKDQSFVTGPDFDPILPVLFADYVRAFEYMLYVSSRLICNYLRTIFDPLNYNAAITESWAKLVIGIACGLDTNANMFTAISPLLALTHASFLTEGTAIFDAFIGGVLPRWSSPPRAPEELTHCKMKRKQYEVLRREKARGRSVRFIVDGFDTDCDRGAKRLLHRFAAFGDYNGKGTFRECYTIEWPQD